MTRKSGDIVGAQAPTPTPSPAGRSDPQSQLDDINELASLGLWAWDPVSGQMTWSEGLFRILGLNQEAFHPTLEGFLARVEAGERARVAELVRAALRDGKPCRYDCPIRLRDGSRRWIRVVGISDQDEAGRTIRMHGTAQDITEFHSASIGGVPDLRDPLTGVASWAVFSDRAESALARAARQGSPTALLVVDLDRFHQVNDQFGHQKGDSVLVEVARRLDAAFRPYDTVARAGSNVARLGGDEFLILCEAVPDAETARDLCRRVAAILEEPLQTEPTLTLSAGVGAALSVPGETTIGTLLTQAESAMRVGKQRGRGAYSVFTPDMADPGGPEGDAARALGRALSEGELRVHYQPKLALDTERIVGVEALLRWQHPERGMVPPLDFIPLAEHTGLIGPIGAWVIEQACQQAARWRSEFPDRPGLVVSVNVSARQFGSELVEVVRTALASTGADPRTLCIEVTESLLMDDFDAAVAVLGRLADLGVALSIDDFGTGYSSLAYLRRFPLDELKIDKSFVDGLNRNSNDTAIVAAVVAMAHALGLCVVAEGVETREQLQRLRTLGCEQAQGYYFARPGPPESIDELLVAEAQASWAGHGPGGLACDTYRPDRVLVVEDAADVRLLASMSLSAVGFEVHEAADGASALASVSEFLPDCVLLDLDLPDVSGLEICRELRSRPETSGCTILILTANDDAAGKVEAFSSGADDYIVKPFSPRDLASRVRSAMRRRVPSS